MFSLAATPPGETTRAHTSLPPDPANFLSTSTFGSNANRLPPGVPLPPGALNPESVRGQFSVNGQGDPSSSSPTAGFPPPGRMPLRPGTASGANSLRNPVFANQQPAPPSMQQPAASESMPLASGAGGGWSIVTSPDRPGQAFNYLQAVTCVSASDCWAVGYSDTGRGFQTLIERWDGTSWAIVTSANTSGAYLYGVTCVSASDCWAVGKYNASDAEQTLILRWDGTSWAIVTSPNTSTSAYNLLLGVACASASDCWAVGYSYVFGTSPPQTLIERWDGTSWAIVSSPSPSTTGGSLLAGVTCVSASDCWAVGSSGQTLIVRWDGTSWAIVTSPAPGVFSSLTSVTCVSASDCWAVGSSGPTLIVRWDGISWAIVISPPAPGALSSLTGVTCVSASDCWAVGSYLAGSTSQTLVERWDGTLWVIATSPPAPGAPSSLTGVTCASASDCWAVGAYSNGSVYQTLLERWDGTSWAIAASPNTLALQNNYLESVTCVSASDCWAVGYYVNGSPDHKTLIERWDGTSWAIVTSPNTSPTQSNYLTGVTCVSASDCWAVGYYHNGTTLQTLIERWDGTAWAIVTSPNILSTQPNILRGVTCVSASDCWAIGYYNGIASQTLIERWDGTSWAIVTSPNTSATQINALWGVTCAAASECWAVGFFDNGSAVETLIERWDGTSWAIVTSPNPSATYNFLWGVTCVSASDCWAVGDYRAGDAFHQTLIERWDGTSWAVVTSPNATATDNALFGVTCASASECWAVGFSATGSAEPLIDQTLIERWDGTSWAIISSPNTSATLDNGLYGVTCAPASDCSAVGYYYASGGGRRTLTMRYTAAPPPVQLVSVVSRKTHGSAGTFDVDLPLTGSPGIECRTGGVNGDYTLVFSFANTLTSVAGASITSGNGNVNSSAIGSDTHQYIVNLTGVTNAQVVTVALTNVNDSAGNSSASGISASMAVLAGDTSSDRFVNSADISQTKAQSGAALTNSNFRQDVTVDGFLNSADISLVKSKSGTALP